MIQETNEISLETKGQRLFNITNLIENVITLSKLNTGLINISIPVSYTHLTLPTIVSV